MSSTPSALRKPYVTEEKLKEFLEEQKVQLKSQQDFYSYLAVYIDWGQAAQYFHISKRQIIRWYRETYLRKMQDQITSEDKRLIRELIQRQLTMGKPLSRDFMAHVESQLSQTYYHITFTACYNNIKSCLQQRCPGGVQLNFIAFEQIV